MLSCFAVLFSVGGLFLFMSCELSQLAIVNAVNVIKIVGGIICSCSLKCLMLFLLQRDRGRLWYRSNPGVRSLDVASVNSTQVSPQIL